MCGTENFSDSQKHVALVISCAYLTSSSTLLMPVKTAVLHVLLEFLLAEKLLLWLLGLFLFIFFLVLICRQQKGNLNRNSFLVIIFKVF